VRNYRARLELDLVFSQQVPIMLRGVIRLRHPRMKFSQKESTRSCCGMELNKEEG
jgi:hypothetical protein